MPELDYLVVDLPPGTGDVALSISQTVPVSGAVVVTTPQTVSLADTRRALRMYQKLNVPILGLVENMSHFTCPHCHQEIDIFSKGGAERTASTALVGRIVGEALPQPSVSRRAPLQRCRGHQTLTNPRERRRTARLADVGCDDRHAPAAAEPALNRADDACFVRTAPIANLTRRRPMAIA